MIATDFLLNQDNDLEIKNGDFFIGASDGQHVQAIFELEPGELKSSPLTGIGIRKQINGNIDGNVRREINLQLQADGYETGLLTITDETISIDAQRNG